jgi:hypothetical protein
MVDEIKGAKISGTGGSVQGTSEGAFARSAKSKTERRIAGAEAAEALVPTLNPEQYDVKGEAQKHAEKKGHHLAGWTAAAEGVPNFWHTGCVNCGLTFYARWRGTGEAAFPEFGSGDPKTYARPCAGEPSADTEGAGRFSATE